MATDIGPAPATPASPQVDRRHASGVVLQGVDEPSSFIAMVREIEELGFDDLWLTDSSLHARNCYAYLTLAALNSDRIRLGTAVTNPLTRHPALTATAVATVDEISGGRAVLGIGTGDRPLLALGLSPAARAELETSVGAIRALWSGDTVNVTSATFRLDDAIMRFPARSSIPIFVAASGPRTLELAGRIADGVILLVGLFTESVRWAIEHVRRGAAQSDRPGHRVPRIAVFAYGAINDDREIAIEDARSIAGWFPQTAPTICALAGLDPAVTASVREVYEGGEFQEATSAARLLPDEFIRRVALAGDRDDARRRLEEVLAAGADSVHVFPLGPRRVETVQRVRRMLARDDGRWRSDS